MAGATVSTGSDTWVGSAKPAAIHNTETYLRLQTGAMYGFVFAKLPTPRGSSIISATLRVFARGASTGSRTLTVKRVAASFKFGSTTWNNKPAVTGSGVTASVGTLADGDPIDFDVTAQATTMQGSNNWGWRLESNAATAHSVYSFEAGNDYTPVLIVTWSDKPDAPTLLRPSGTISIAKWVAQFDYSDLAGSTELAAVQVRIDASANPASLDYDSGEVPWSVPEVDLSRTDLPGGTYGGLSDAATTQWQARVQDSAGLWSDYSDWVTVTRDNQGTPAITYPSSGTPTVTEPTPTITATLTGETLKKYRVWVTSTTNRNRVYYDSGEVSQAGGSISHTIPETYKGNRVLEAGSYSLGVRMWDTKARVASPGDVPYVEVWRDFTMADGSPTGGAPTSVVATLVSPTPAVDITWSRATTPDSWVVLRDDVVVASDLDPADTLVSGTAYTWRDWAAKPYASHVYKVKAVVTGVQSAAGTASAVTPVPKGVWVIDPVRNLTFVCRGTGVDNWAMTDQAAIYRPLGSASGIRVTTALYGLEGSFTGELSPYTGRTLASLESTLWSIKSQPSATLRLVTADSSFPIILGDLSCSPSPDAKTTDLRKVVSFTFMQVGNLPFTAAL